MYHTLRTLEDRGIICRVARLRDSTRFDANITPHYHFVCTRCGLMANFTDPRFDGIQRPPAVASMGAVNGIHLALRGTCNSCLAAGGKQ